MNEDHAKENVSPNKITPGKSPKRASSSALPSAKKALRFSQEVIVPATPPDQLPPSRLSTTLQKKDDTEQKIQLQLDSLIEKYNQSIRSIKDSLLYSDAQHPALNVDNEAFVEWLSEGQSDLYGDLARQRIEIQKVKQALMQCRQNNKTKPTVLMNTIDEMDVLDFVPATPSPSAELLNIAHPWYFENEISTLINLGVRPFGGFNANHQYRLSGIGAAGTYPDEDQQYYVVFVTPAIDTQGAKYIEKFSADDAEGISSIDLAYYFDKSTRPLGKMESIIQTIIDAIVMNKSRAEIAEYIVTTQREEKLELDLVASAFAQSSDLNVFKALLQTELERLLAFQRDVFDEMRDLMVSTAACHIKILFPYNITQTHWLLGEIKVHKNEMSHDYVLEVFAHDPFGGGNIAIENQEKLQATLLKKITELDSHANVSIAFLQSPYNARQQRGDGNSCGAIVVRDALYRITGGSLSVEQPFDIGAPSLRCEHLQLMQNANEDSVRDNFRARHQQLAIIPPAPSAVARRELPEVEKPQAHGVVADEAPVMQATETKLIGSSLIEILKNAGHKFLKQNGKFDDTPDEGNVYVLIPEFGSKIVVVDMPNQRGKYNITGSARGDYLCSNNEFLVMKPVDKNIKAMLEGSCKVWQGAFTKFRKNIYPSQVEFVLVFSFKTEINEEQLKHELGQLFEKLNVSSSEESFPKFRFLYPFAKKMALSQKYSVADCKKAFSPKKLKYNYTSYPASAAAKKPADIYSECKKIYEDILQFDIQFIAGNPLYKLVSDKKDYKSTVKYFLPKELTDIKLHINHVIRALGNLSTNINQSMCATDKNDSAFAPLQQLHALVKADMNNITFMQQRLKDLQALYLGNEKQESDAQKKFIQIKENLLIQFRKTLATSVQTLLPDDAIEAWFHAHEFTVLACISSIQRSFQFAKTSLEQNVAKLLGFYWMLEHPAAELKPIAKSTVTVPSSILNLVRAEDKEQMLNTQFNAMVRCLAEGFNTPGNRQDNLTQKLRNVDLPGSHASLPIIVL